MGKGGEEEDGGGGGGREGRRVDEMLGDGVAVMVGGIEILIFDT